MKIKNLTVLATMLVAIIVTLPAFGQSGSNIARMNAGALSNMTITSHGVQAIEQVAAARPGLEMMLEQELGLDWRGNLEIVDSWHVPAGRDFINSGLDRRGTPTQWEQIARSGGFTAVRIRSKVTARVVIIKDDCLNPINRVPGVPMSPRPLNETSNTAEVNFDLSMEVNIDFSPVIETQATATATTAPINIVINNVTQAPPLMTVGGSLANQYAVVRDGRDFLSLGYVHGGGTRINILNANINELSQSQSSVNNNNISNSNSNSNANTNVVNVGGGTKKSTNHLLDAIAACVGGVVDSLAAFGGGQPSQGLATV